MTTMNPKKLVLSTYRPNFNDPRVQNKVKRVLEYCKPLLVRRKPKKIPSREMTKVFGNGRGQLASRLRYKLLQQESAFRTGVSSTTYTVKREGFAELAEAIGMPVKSNVEIARELYGPIARGVERIEYSEPTPGARRYHQVQNMPRALRADVFRGWFDYDIEAAAPTLLYQHAWMVMKDVCEEVFPALAELVADRVAVRMHVADVAGIDLDTAKSVIVGLLFGARLVAYERHAIFIAVQRERTVIERLRADSYVQRLQRDVKELWETLFLAEDLRYLQVPPPGPARVLAPRAASKRRMALYLRLERKVIDVIEDVLKKDGVEPVLIHDGFMTPMQLDRGRLERAVLERTGYRIRLAEAQLGMQCSEPSDAPLIDLAGFPEGE